MSAGSALDQLAALRHQAEQRALDLLQAQNERCRLLQQKADASADAVSRQTAQARVREQSLVGTLIGRPVSPRAILRVQAEVTRAALEITRLREEAARAQAALAEQRTAQAAAQAHFHARRLAAMKLDLLLQQETARRTLRQVALGECDDEERGAGARPAIVA